jgi:hypothetical protein
MDRAARPVRPLGTPAKRPSDAQLTTLVSAQHSIGFLVTVALLNLKEPGQCTSSLDIQALLKVVL